MQRFHFIWYQCSVNNCGQSPKSVVVATHNISCVDRCSIPCFVLLNADWDSTKWLFWHNMVGPLYTVIWCRWNIGSFVDTCQLLTGIHNVTTYTLGDCYYRLHFSRHTSHMCNLCHIYLNSTNSKPDRLSDFYKSSHVHLCHLRCMVTGLLIYLLTSWAHSREMWGSQNHHHMNAAVQLQKRWTWDAMLQKRWTWDAILKGLALYIVLANFGYY